MRNIITLARKELSIYFSTVGAWVVFTAMAFLSSWFFIANLMQFKQVQEAARSMGWARMGGAEMYKNLTDGVVLPTWGVILIVTLFGAPFLSMGLFAQERKQKSFELLMTTPIRAVEIVLGKFLGAIGVITATLGVTLVYPLILSVYGASESGSALEWSTVWLGYLGVWLFGVTCMAVGMFISSLTESQAVAAFVTFAVSLVWFILGTMVQSAEEPLRGVVMYLSYNTQLENLMKGVLDLKAIVFFGSVMLFSLFLTHRSVESQRWA